MSQVSTTSTAAPASGAASSAWSAQPLAFRKDTEDGFPLGGAVLLIVLMTAAVWAWWYGRARGRVPMRLPGVLGALTGRACSADGELRIVETLQGLGGVRLMVVEWSGGRRVLVATSGAHAPVTLDTMQPISDSAKPKP